MALSLALKRYVWKAKGGKSQQKSSGVASTSEL
jgi:hypothetical protein